MHSDVILHNSELTKFRDSIKKALESSYEKHLEIFPELDRECFSRKEFSTIIAEFFADTVNEFINEVDDDNDMKG